MDLDCYVTDTETARLYVRYSTKEAFDLFLQNNEFTINVPLRTPVYEKIDYNPFEVY